MRTLQKNHRLLSSLCSTGALLFGCLLLWIQLTGCTESMDLVSAQETASSAPAMDNSADFDSGASATQEESGNTNVNLSGSSDFGYFRQLLDNSIVPQVGDFDSAGFFAEHYSTLPEPDCGEVVCTQTLLGVMGNLSDGEPCTLLQVGLNSPLVADPSERPPLTLSVVVDTSGSMRSGEKISFVRDGLEYLIDALHDDDQVSLVNYSDNAEVLFEMSEIGDNRSALREIVQSLEASGGTNLYEGLERGFLEVVGHYDSGRQNRVIILSDGQPTSGITEMSAIMAMSSAYNSEGIGLTTVGLGTDFNVSLMSGLAEQADGNYYFLEDAGAVEEVFSEEISYFTVPIAFDLEIKVREGAQFSFGRAYGTTMWEDTEGGGHLLVPSLFLAHRESDSDITEEGGRRGGGSTLLIELMPRLDGSQADVTLSDVAEVEISFREPGTDRIVHETVLVTYPMPPWEVPVEGYFDGADLNVIQKSFVMLNIYVGLERACELFHDGRGEMAIGILQRLIAAVEDFNDGLNDGEGDVDMEMDIALMSQLISVLQSNGSMEPEQNEIPQDPWPAD